MRVIVLGLMLWGSGCGNADCGDRCDDNEWCLFNGTRKSCEVVCETDVPDPCAAGECTGSGRSCATCDDDLPYCE
ncbi:MAG: hypothetical protein AB8H79_06080 [Myxococcota bacterium]